MPGSLTNRPGNSLANTQHGTTAIGVPVRSPKSTILSVGCCDVQGSCHGQIRGLVSIIAGEMFRAASVTWSQCSPTTKEQSANALYRASGELECTFLHSRIGNVSGKGDWRDFGTRAERRVPYGLLGKDCGDSKEASQTVSTTTSAPHCEHARMWREPTYPYVAFSSSTKKPSKSLL